MWTRLSAAADRPIWAVSTLNTLVHLTFQLPVK